MNGTKSSEENLISEQRLRSLQAAVGSGPLLIMTHDNPDPDALAAGVVLAALFEQKWAVKTFLGYSGLVDRSENKAMLQLLTPQWVPLEDLDNLQNYPAIALVDTQPGTGNNSLPDDLTPKVVFDHHLPIQDGCEFVAFVDINPEIGATTSLVYRYFEAADLEPDSDLASAVFYGIQTDTQGLMRSYSNIDQEIYIKTLTKINRKKLNQVIHARLPREYYRAFDRGLQAAQVFGKLVVAYLGELHRPDFVAELADYLVRLQGIEAVLCMGNHGTTMYLSLRTPSFEDNAGQIIQELVAPHGKAGGHDSIAGGQIGLHGENARHSG